MDYEKEYKRAREICRWLLANSKISESAATDLFRDIVVIEDERIREHLITHFQKKTKGEWDGMPVKRILAWLEKQKEQTQYDIDVLERHITKDSVSELAHTVIVRNGWEIVEANEQKPAEWSENDRDKIAEYLHDRGGGMLWSKATEIAEDILGMISPQPKQEWSEEDRLKLRLCIESLDVPQTKRHIYEHGITPDELKAWLNSLRPQPHWKPSEEQLKALRYVAYHLMPDANYRNEMFSLYYDLKDL